MKKPLYFLMLVVFLSVFQAHASAEETERLMLETLIGPDASLASAAIAGETLYLLDTAGAITAVTKEGRASHLLRCDGAELLAGGDVLRVVVPSSGKVGVVAEGGMDWLGEIDRAVLDADDPWLLKAVWSDGSLYLLYCDSDTWLQRKLARFDPSSNTTYALEITNLQEISAYRGGQLLAVLFEPASLQSRAVVLDGATGRHALELPALEGYQCGGLAYDAAADAVYLCDSGRVMRLAPGGWETVNYVPQLRMSNIPFTGILSGGVYVLVRQDGLFFKDVSSAALPETRPLVIRGMGLDPNLYPQFMREHPDIPLVADDQPILQIDPLVTAVQSRDPSVDIYILPDFIGAWRLIDKGYAENLSQYAPVKAALDRMLLAARDAVSRDGQYYALPVLLGLDAWFFRPELFGEAGYDRLPQTLLEYFQMLCSWETERKADFDFSFQTKAYSSDSLRRYDCVYMAVMQYILEYERPNQPLTFDTEPFRQVLAAIEALPCGPADVDQMLAEIAEQSQWAPPPAAIFEWGDTNMLQVGVADAQVRELIPPPPFEAGNQSKAFAYLYVAILNPNSMNKEAAARFLAYAAENLAPESRISLYPDEAEPILFHPILTTLEDIEADLKKLRQLLETAGKAHRAGILDNIAQLEATRAVLQEKRYSVTAKAIKLYHQMDPYLFIPRDSLYFSLPPETQNGLLETLKRYAAGELDSERLIRELDQKMSMLFLEQ